MLKSKTAHVVIQISGRAYPFRFIIDESGLESAAESIFEWNALLFDKGTTTSEVLNDCKEIATSKEKIVGLIKGAVNLLYWRTEKK